MNRLRAWVRNAFGFSRTETNAFIILLPLLTLIIFSEPLFRYGYGLHSKPDYNPNQLDSLIATWEWEKPRTIDPPTVFSALHSFNPNLSSESELKQLGIPEKLASRITHYRAKGGVFRTKRDLSKIYGFDSLLFVSLAPYIQLPDLLPQAKENKPIVPPRPASVEPFDLNAADSMQLISIHGVGPKRSSTIMKYRKKLGGFIAMEQLSEVFGLDSTVIIEIKAKTFIDNSFVPQKLNINRLNENQMRAFPYFSFRLAKAIVAYRFQHGQFFEVDDLRKIAILDEATYKKIKPYLTTKD